MENQSLLDFSEYISADVQAVFSLNPKKNSRIIIAEKIGYEAGILCIPEQVHGNKVDWVDSPGEYFGTDSLVTQNPQIILTLKVADCVPVFLSGDSIPMVEP